MTSVAGSTAFTGWTAGVQYITCLLVNWTRLQAQGLKPQIKFVLADYLDYEDQEEVIYNGFRYKVLRTFRTEENEIEIVCYGGIRMEVVNDGDSEEHNED